MAEPPPDTSSSLPHRGLSAHERERIARATRAALRGLLTRLRASLDEIEERSEPWPAKWTALKLSARRVVEEHEAAGTPLAVIAVETARAMLAEMRRLEERNTELQSGAAMDEAARWQAMKRWLSTRAVMHNRAE